MKTDISFSPAFAMATVTMDPGDRLLIRALVLYRITAITDSRVLEVSTARAGWRKDVVRFPSV